VSKAKQIFGEKIKNKNAIAEYRTHLSENLAE
jgi:hypothetical protein